MPNTPSGNWYRRCVYVRMLLDAPSSGQAMPNIVAPLIVMTSVCLSSAILSEAALSFLGLGTQPPAPAWGGMLNLELSGGHVVFDVNLRSAQKAGLQISSKALRLARKVIE